MTENKPKLKRRSRNEGKIQFTFLVERELSDYLLEVSRHLEKRAIGRVSKTDVLRDLVLRAIKEDFYGLRDKGTK
jgi:hypothetical protein